MDGNVLRCLILSVVFVAYLVVTWTFMPLFLVRVRQYEAGTMSWMMGVLGIAATLFSFAITALSDRIGRRPVLMVAPVLALVLPLGALYLPGPAWALGILFFIGWTFTGVMPLFMATVPAESVGPGRIGSALGLCMGGSEVLGGVIAPLVCGFAADRAGLQAPLWGLVVLAVAGSLATIGLRETAPRVLDRRAGRPAG
jgi:predicted MFS family arabinose efflux permease